MREPDQRSYGAVPAEEQQFNSLSNRRDQSPVQDSEVIEEDEKKAEPRPIDSSWLSMVVRLTFDLGVIILPLLFTIFGILVYRMDGTSATAGTAGYKLSKASQYVSCRNLIIRDF
jgi:hypothetical protein